MHRTPDNAQNTQHKLGVVFSYFERNNNNNNSFYYVLISRGCQFQATENASKTRNTTLKTNGKLPFSFFLHYISIWDQKVQNSVFHEAFLPITWIKPSAGDRNTVNTQGFMSRLTSRSIEQFGWSASG